MRLLCPLLLVLAVTACTDSIPDDTTDDTDGPVDTSTTDDTDLPAPTVDEFLAAQPTLLASAGEGYSFAVEFTDAFDDAGLTIVVDSAPDWLAWDDGDRELAAELIGYDAVGTHAIALTVTSASLPDGAPFEFDLVVEPMDLQWRTVTGTFGDGWGYDANSWVEHPHSESQNDGFLQVPAATLTATPGANKIARFVADLPRARALKELTLVVDIENVVTSYHVQFGWGEQNLSLAHEVSAYNARDFRVDLYQFLPGRSGFNMSPNTQITPGIHELALTGVMPPQSKGLLLGATLDGELFGGQPVTVRDELAPDQIYVQSVDTNVKLHSVRLFDGEVLVHEDSFE